MITFPSIAVQKLCLLVAVSSISVLANELPFGLKPNTTPSQARQLLAGQSTLEFFREDPNELYWVVKGLTLNGVPVALFGISFHENTVLKAQFISSSHQTPEELIKSLYRLRDHFSLVGIAPSNDLIKNLQNREGLEAAYSKSLVTISGAPCDIDIYARRIDEGGSWFANVTYYVMDNLRKKRNPIASDTSNVNTKPSVSSGSGEAVTLFSIGETSGQYLVLAKNGSPLSKPEVSEDKTPDPQIIQMINKSSGEPSFVLITNSGNVDAKVSRVGDAVVFHAVTDSFHSTLTICFNRKFPDGSFLVIETMIRPDLLGIGVTTARVFTGRARPSPVVKTIFGLN
jgi:hypothetical protein